MPTPAPNTIRRTRYPLIPITVAGRVYLPVGHCSAGQRGWFQSRASLILCDEASEPRICLVRNRHREMFAVSCSRRADKSLWYMHGIASSDEAFVGLPASTWDRADAVRAVFDTLCGAANGAPVAKASQPDVLGRLSGQQAVDCSPATEARIAYSFGASLPNASFHQPEQPANAAVSRP